MKINAYKYFIFDIEGTVAPISFVHEVLFPYSKKKLLSYLQTHSINQNLYDSIEKEYKQDINTKTYTNKLSNEPELLYDYLSYLISVDRKSPGLKEIQGEIWKFGYENGELQSTLYQDTLDFFEKLNSQEKIICIYSSGSVLAQKLIFKYSNLGDLTKYISNYFDTAIGFKRDPKSYTNLLNAIQSQPSEACFFTDIYEEALAGNSIGIACYILKRMGNGAINGSEFSIIDNFLDWK